jgi:pyruvate/2-oxoglutarate dehydrogenase complex dihydrolipoamide dehydrogenase (E3) component
MERVQRVIQNIAPHDSVERYTELGVDVVQGTAKDRLAVGGRHHREDGSKQRLSTRSIVIATGAKPFVPPIPGIEAVGYLTSDNIWDLRELPKRLVVLGGGPIGSELTQAFARFGAQVSQVEMGARIMAREDPEVSELVMQRFRDEGVAVLVNHRAKEFVIENGEKILIAEHAGKDVRIPFDAVLVAVGRAANLKGFGLEELGIPTGALSIPMNSCKPITPTFTPPEMSPGRSNLPTPPRTKPGMPRSTPFLTHSRSSRRIIR